MTRKEINDKIDANKAEILRLQNENYNLENEAMLLSDESQWFTEVEEDVLVKKRPKKIERKLMGRIHWNEDFKDDGTGEVITIERSQLVRINGEWVY